MVDLNEAFGWTDEYILTLTEGQVITKIYELRQRDIRESVAKIEAYGEKGVETLERLKDYDPMKRYWIKKHEARLRKEYPIIEKHVIAIAELMKKIDGEKVH